LNISILAFLTGIFGDFEFLTEINGGSGLASIGISGQIMGLETPAANSLRGSAIIDLAILDDFIGRTFIAELEEISLRTFETLEEILVSSAEGNDFLGLFNAFSETQVEPSGTLRTSVECRKGQTVGDTLGETVVLNFQSGVNEGRETFLETLFPCIEGGG